ncbi:TonB-dependent receptor plug domain-containing protein [uncultured Chryseobacterium sp.]|uniref:TonB-dependent receptor n=1 Tax=uncultured Chryseobacterium sp. TaxID=259322 RepID=UPI0025E216F5|nr:TonB-dependent receptor plug domain-containing protein [uncultured Chryseobacterium sp.]
MMIRFLTSIILFLSGYQLLLAQNDTLQLTVYVTGKSGEKLSDVTVNSTETSLVTDRNGRAVLYLKAGKHHLQFSHSSYQEKESDIDLKTSTTLTVQLQPVDKLEEVVMFSKESRGLTTKTVIDRKAMEHLQPSSFTDLMELLPGGLAKVPDLNANNRPVLRENRGSFSAATTAYNTTALGVQFMVDGNVLNSNADMQVSLDNKQFAEGPRDRETATTGVDMRTISTNDIEKVEIIRGIPSASYGDLTSGVIKIDRKIGQSPLQARFKADGFSKQYYVGKGFKINNNWQISAGADFLDSKATPTDDFENYQRITASVRSRKKGMLWSNPLEWRSSVDFSTNIDSKKNDPDNGAPEIDRYRQTRTRISLTNNFIYTLDKAYFFDNIMFNTAVRQGVEKIDQTKLVQLSGPRSFSLATEQGENIGIFPALRYISDFSTDGKPLDITVLLQTTGTRNTWGIRHQYEAGLDWRYSKNNGKGLVYDMNSPYAAAFSNTRPRPFNDIPASNLIAAFLGDRMSYALDRHIFTLYAGVRFSRQLGIDRSYAISKKVFAEPRINLQYNLPHIMIHDAPLKADVTLGYGQFYKQPNLLMLYPNRKFWDYTQLNYYHNDERYRYVNFMTYVQNLENKELTAAKSIKKEIRLDLSYRHHNVFITYFKEDMSNGFRQMLHTVLHTYRQYDASQVDLSQWNNGPDLAHTPYVVKKTNANYSITENGSTTIKNGVEFGYTSPRFKAINTRFTLSGAYFKTQYRNSMPVTESPKLSIGPDGYPYYGIYQNDEGYVNSNMNYNLFVDTYIPKLDLTISASFQGSFFDYRRKDQRIAEPMYYYGIDGVLHPFTEADKTDAYKQWLVRNVSVTDNMPTELTFTFGANLKVTKSIYRDIKTSMFVTRIFNYSAPYYFNNLRIDRKAANRPYFGMELTYNF